MNKEELKKQDEKIINEHLFTEDEELVKNYKENPPQVIRSLAYMPGEAIISELDKKDLIQLFSRYLNNDGVYTKNILHLLLRIEKLLSWLCEEEGINVKEKFKEDAKIQAEELEKRIQESKEALQNIKN